MLKLRKEMRLNFIFPLLLGIWPTNKNTSILIKIIQQLLLINAIFVVLIQVVPCFIYLFEDHNLMTKMKLLGPIIFCIDAVIKILFFVKNIDEIGAFFKHVEEDWNVHSSLDTEQELNIMKDKAKSGRIIAVICAVCMYSAGILYHIMLPLTGNATFPVQLITSTNLKSRNASNILNYEIRTLVSPISQVFLTIDQKSTYNIVYFLQIYGGFIAYTITTGVCTIVAGFVVHNCGQLQIVMLMLNQYINSKNSSDSNTNSAKHCRQIKMAKIIQHHLRALNFAERLKTNFNFPLFTQFVNCTLNIGLLEYYVVVGNEVQSLFNTIAYMMLYLSIFFNIFIICYIGQLLTEQNEKISDFIYKLNWFILPRRAAIDLIMIFLIVSISPTKLTAGFVIDLNLRTFAGMIQKSASCFQLLRTVT